MVLPSPTSSARIAPLESGELKAKRAASIWCGFKSTAAFNSDAFNFCSSFEEHFLVSSQAQYFEWYFVKIEIVYIP